jgi:hypothetical protein
MAKEFAYMQVPLTLVATDLTGATVEVEGAYFRAARLIAVNGPMKLEDIRRKVGTHADVEHALNWRSTDADPLLSFSWVEEWRERANAARERTSRAGQASAEKRAKKKGKKNNSSTHVEQPLSSGSTNVEHTTILYSTVKGDLGEERAIAAPTYPKDFPPSMRTPEALAAWNDWEASRREKRKPLTTTARRLQLADCAEWGTDRAIAALKHSAKGNYQGLFLPSGYAAPTASELRKSTEPAPGTPITLGQRTPQN